MNKSDYGMRQFSIRAFDGTSWIDVTKRRAIIYGAGRGCIDMMNELLLPNVSMIIDRNEDLLGKQIMLMSQVYEISSPQVLKELECDKYYIVVSSIKYFEDIKEDIFKLCGSNYLVCKWEDEIRFCYKSLEAMMLTDNSVHRKLTYSGMTRKAYDIISDFYELKNSIKLMPHIDFFIPLKKGYSKFSFMFGNSEKLWVYHHIGYVSSIEKKIIRREDSQLKRIREEYIDNHGLDSLLTLCKRKNSVIQVYAENKLNLYDKKIRHEIIKKMRELHLNSAENLPDCDFTNAFFESFVERLRYATINDEKKHDVLDGIYHIGRESANYIENNTTNKCVIHGDLVWDNVVAYRNEICFIDWEYLSKGFPEIDLCYFLFSIHFGEFEKEKLTYIEMCKRCYGDIEGALYDYYDNEEKVKKYTKLAYAVMDLFFIRDVLQTCLWNIELGIKKTNDYIAEKRVEH